MQRGDEMRTRSKGTKWAASLSILLLHRKGFREMGTKVGEGEKELKVRPSSDKIQTFGENKDEWRALMSSERKLLHTFQGDALIWSLMEAHKLSDVRVYTINKIRNFRGCYEATQSCTRTEILTKKTSTEEEVCTSSQKHAIFHLSRVTNKLFLITF